MNWFGRKNNKSGLTVAIEKMAANPSVENQKHFAEVLSSYAENGTWVPMPVCQDQNGYRLKIIKSRESIMRQCVLMMLM